MTKIWLQKEVLLFCAMVTLLGAPSAKGQQAASTDKQAAGANVTVVTSPDPAIGRLLPDAFAGIRATSDTRLFTRDDLSGLVNEKSPIYQEYRVSAAASREYVGVRVDVFETRNRFAAFGLFTFNAGPAKSKPLDIGAVGAQLEDSLVFWKGNYFVRVNDTRKKSGRAVCNTCETLARAIADSIGTPNATDHPSLLDSLPARSLSAASKCYFLGPESLNAYVEHGREMFEFNGDTEAVMGQYFKGASDQASPGTLTRSDTESSMRLVIVEYHTPQFATDAMERVTRYVEGLPETEQQRIIVKRTGNYIVEAVNVGDREFAEGLVNGIEYPYTVKWLRNPLWPTNDPFRTQKAAEMLLSTFGFLGLILMTVLAGGTIFGTTIFLKRRKRQQEIFSDAGGMLRLDIDPFESAILGLPPKRSEE